MGGKYGKIRGIQEMSELKMEFQKQDSQKVEDISLHYIGATQMLMQLASRLVFSHQQSVWIWLSVSMIQTEMVSSRLHQNSIRDLSSFRAMLMEIQNSISHLTNSLLKVTS